MMRRVRDGRWVTRPILGPHGPTIVISLCVYEVVALIPGSPLPSITEINRTHVRPLGFLLCLVGLHHFYLEDPEYYVEITGGMFDGALIPVPDPS